MSLQAVGLFLLSTSSLGGYALGRLVRAVGVLLRYRPFGRRGRDAALAAQLVVGEQRARELAVQIMGLERVEQLEMGLPISLPSTLAPDRVSYTLSRGSGVWLLMHDSVLQLAANRSVDRLHLCIVPRSHQYNSGGWDYLISRYLMIAGDERELLRVANANLEHRIVPLAQWPAVYQALFPDAELVVVDGAARSSREARGVQ